MEKSKTIIESEKNFVKGNIPLYLTYVKVNILYENITWEQKEN